MDQILIVAILNAERVILKEKVAVEQDVARMVTSVVRAILLIRHAKTKSVHHVEILDKLKSHLKKETLQSFRNLLFQMFRM